MNNEGHKRTYTTIESNHLDPLIFEIKLSFVTIMVTHIPPPTMLCAETILQYHCATMSFRQQELQGATPRRRYNIPKEQSQLASCFYPRVNRIESRLRWHNDGGGRELVRPRKPGRFERGHLEAAHVRQETIGEIGQDPVGREP